MYDILFGEGQESQCEHLWCDEAIRGWSGVGTNLLLPFVFVDCL